MTVNESEVHAADIHVEEKVTEQAAVSDKKFVDVRYSPIWDLDAEAIVLCGLFERPMIFDLVRAKLTDDDFGAGSNRRIWQAICAAVDSGKEILPSHVWAVIDDKDWVGNLGDSRDSALGYLRRILTRTPDYSLCIDPFVDRIVEKSRVRKAKWLADQIQASVLGYKGDIQVFIDRAVVAFRELADRRNMLSMVHVSEVLRAKEDAWQTVDEARGRTAMGVECGLSDVDDILGGLRDEALIVLAARPGIGKSAWALNVATCVANNGGSVAFFSLEMSKEELTDRQLSFLAGLHVSREGKLGETAQERVRTAADQLAKTPLWIDDAGDNGMLEVRAKCKRLEIERKRFGGRGLSLVVVDYVGLMKEPYGARSREQAIAGNSRGMKLLAKELKCPVLLICQMNRNVEARTGRPKLSDLRESGALEQDADVVLFLHREPKKDGDSTLPVTELIIAKNRNGPVGLVKLLFRGSITRFDQLSNN